MEVLRGRAFLPAQEEKENAVLGKGTFKDVGNLPSASKAGLQSRKVLAGKQVTLLVPENPGLSNKTPGPSAKTPGRRALGDITNANQGSKAAKTPKLKEGSKAGQTPGRKVLANITNQLQKQGVREGLGDAVEAQTKEAASDRQRKAVRRTAYGRRIVPGVSFRLSAQEKAEIRERASSLAETGVEHVHVTGRQLEEMQSRSEDKDVTGSMRRLLGLDSDHFSFLNETSPTSDLPSTDGESRLEPDVVSPPFSPTFKATGHSSPLNAFDDNDLLRASLDVLPSLSDRELEFDWPEGDMDIDSDAESRD